MTNSLKTLNAYMVNILKSKQSDINDEIKNNILAEMDKYNPGKIESKNTSSTSSNQEVLQTNTY
jgi:Ca2+-binding EF-hand superfamily protein